ncbi:hypothetical protein [Halarcobacter sp.]
MDFFVIELTSNQALNYFFSFPIYTMFVSLPFIAILDLIKKV